MQNETEKPSAARNVSPSDRINEFVQKHRRPIFASAGLLLLSLIVFIAVLSVMDVLRGKAISAVEELGSRYETLRPTIAEEFSAVDVEELIADLEAFARKNSGYAGGRAWAIVAAIHSEKKDWEACEAAWASAASAARKTYLVPLAWFNAGAAAEEQGKAEEAIGHYASSLSMSADFPGAARAQFAIGRLQESQGDTQAAIDAYQAVISGWPSDRVWPSLARSRIIVLEAE